LSPTDSTYLYNEIKELKEAGIIIPSNSPWSSPTFVVRTANHRARKVVDYRKVNLLTVPDVYPIPDLNSIFDALGESTYFGTSDLKSGFLQVGVEPSSQPITAFVSPFGLHEYRRAAFGLRNCPAHFMRCMDGILDTQGVRAGGPMDGGGNAMFVDDAISHGVSFS
jgi:hypothetical protein